MSSKLIKTSFIIIIITLTSAFIFLWFSIDINPEVVTTIYGSPALYDINGKLFHVRLSPDSERQI
ncbi:MAG: hypothetical protein IJS42_01665, partial [Synergistaceae bacterium]|nr:hypothetical protein [Synergistaceae bacterium]